MQPKDSATEPDLEGYETIKQKKSDQQNIREIVEKHPYKKWEDIENNGTVTN